MNHKKCKITSDILVEIYGFVYSQGEARQYPKGKLNIYLSLETIETCNSGEAAQCTQAGWEGTEARDGRIWGSISVTKRGSHCNIMQISATPAYCPSTLC